MLRMLPSPPSYHKEFSDPYKVKQSPLLSVVLLINSIILIEEQGHANHDQQHNEVLPERVGSVTQENTEYKNGNWLGRLSKSLHKQIKNSLLSVV